MRACLRKDRFSDTNTPETSEHIASNISILELLASLAACRSFTIVFTQLLFFKLIPTLRPTMLEIGS
jgi:hypothetical protein